MKNKNFKKIVIALLFVTASFSVGLLSGYVMTHSTGPDIPWTLFLLFCAVSLFVQTVIHELGHLVCGLLTGYRFLSFRIFSLVLQKTDSRFSLRRCKLAGTAGQCLLIPPKYNGGRYPFLLYNLGGVLFNLLSAMIFLLLYFLCRRKAVSVLFFFLCAFGFISAATNGIPIETKLIANDGANIRILCRDATARRAMWLQLEVNRRQTEGQRLRDMPEDCFTLPEGADLHVPLISAVLVLEENRRMDKHEFDRARECIDFLFSDKCSILGLYATLLTADRVTIELLQKGSEADVSALHEKNTEAMLRKMKDMPSVIRTRYAEALLKERSTEKADRVKKHFEKAAKSYPVAADLLCEAELMALADEAAAAQ